jgi:hypothetical protein
MIPDSGPVDGFKGSLRGVCAKLAGFFRLRERRFRYIPILWAALSQGNRLDHASTYNGFGV